MLKRQKEWKSVTQNILERCLKYAKTIWILWRYSKNSFLHFQKSFKTTFIWLLGFMLLFIKLLYRTLARLWQYYNLKRGTLLYLNLYSSKYLRVFLGNVYPHYSWSKTRQNPNGLTNFLSPNYKIDWHKVDWVNCLNEVLNVELLQGNIISQDSSHSYHHIVTRYISFLTLHICNTP